MESPRGVEVDLQVERRMSWRQISLLATKNCSSTRLAIVQALAVDGDDIPFMIAWAIAKSSRRRLDFIVFSGCVISAPP